MNRKHLAALLLLTLFIALLVFTGCSGTNTMLMGRWSMTGIGDANGENPQAYPLPVVVDIYPDGHVDFMDSKFGTYTKDRDTFTFVFTDSGETVSGSFKLAYPNLTIFPDNAPASYVFEKQMDLDGLQKYLKDKATAATATPAAPVGTPAPAATPAATASSAS